MRLLIEAVYCMTWIWTLHRAHNQWKSPIEEDNVWARARPTTMGARAQACQQTVDSSIARNQAPANKQI